MVQTVPVDAADVLAGRYRLVERLGFDEYGFSVYVRLSAAPPEPPRAPRRG